MRSPENFSRSCPSKELSLSCDNFCIYPPLLEHNRELSTSEISHIKSLLYNPLEGTGVSPLCAIYYIYSCESISQISFNTYFNNIPSSIFSQEDSKNHLINHAWVVREHYGIPPKQFKSYCELYIPGDIKNISD